MNNYKVTGQDPTTKKDFTRILEAKSLDKAEAEAYLLFGEDNVHNVEFDTAQPKPLTPRDYMELFVKFGLNYESGFISRAFPNMADHLQSKFNSLYDRYGANAVMVRFWCELDLENQRHLADYILGQRKNIL